MTDPTDDQIVNTYATRRHYAGKKLVYSTKKYEALCGYAYGMTFTQDAYQRELWGQKSRDYAKLPLCKFCIKAAQVLDEFRATLVLQSTDKEN